MSASRIAENLQRVQSSIADATPGRNVTLVCVTKYATLEHAAALITAGAQHIGENQFPQASNRFNELHARGLDFTGHMLGPLQSRKLRLCAESCDWYQALERVDVAHKLSEELRVLGHSMDVLVQVKVGEEESKHGVEMGEVGKFIERLGGMGTLAHSNSLEGETVPSSATAEGACATGTLRLRGLMCIPPGPSFYASEAEWERGTRESFRQMADLFARMQAAYPDLPLETLSMGMSADYRWAIEAGATMVRVGRALFEGLS